VTYMKVGRCMVIVIHCDDHAEKPTNFRHYSSQRSKSRWEGGTYLISGNRHGPRYGFCTMAICSALPLTRTSFAGSHCTRRPVRRAMLPKWQTVAERWPISTSQIGQRPARIDSSQLAW